MAKVLLIGIHHIASDGWSRAVLYDEILQLYPAFQTGEPSPLNPLPLQYADFALWQRQWLQGSVREEQLQYWVQQLAELTPLTLQTDRPRPPIQTDHGATSCHTLAPGLTQQLKELGRQENTTLFMTVLAAFNVLLSRYSGQEDIALGAPIANRNRAEIEGLIGFFA
ncbi:condensation domain-containing protein, partial [Armatimonas sp.]|uniref:condensation domain-containing protein n=1 Tax=Armatimonas sp. TaxID=1872638 RepID=UPI00286B495B